MKGPTKPPRRRRRRPPPAFAADVTAVSPRPKAVPFAALRSIPQPTPTPPPFSGFAAGKGILPPPVFSGSDTPTIGPRTVPFRPEDEEDFEVPFGAALREVLKAARTGAERFSDTLLPGVSPAVRTLGNAVIGGLGQQLDDVATAVRDRDIPGAGGRESVVNAILPLALNFYPLGAAPAVAERAGVAGAEALARGGVGSLDDIVTRPGTIDEVFAALRAKNNVTVGPVTPAEAEVARDAFGNVLTNRDRVIRASAPPLPRPNTMPDLRVPVVTGGHLNSPLRPTGPLPRPNTMPDLRVPVAPGGHLEASPFAPVAERVLPENAPVAERVLPENAPVVEVNAPVAERVLPENAPVAERVPPENAPVAERVPPENAGGNAGGRLLLAEGLDRDAAVALNRESQLKGLPTEIRRAKDGTFEVWQKGEGAAAPQLATRIEAKKAQQERAFALAGLTDEERATFEGLSSAERANHPLNNRVAAAEEAMDLGLTDEDARTFIVESQKRSDAQNLNEALKAEIDQKRVDDPDNNTLDLDALDDLDSQRVNAVVERNRASSVLDDLREKGNEAKKLGGLKPSEKEMLAAMRESETTVANAISTFEDQVAQTGDATAEMQAAYEEAVEHLRKLRQDIGTLAPREHLPPAAETAVARGDKTEVARSFPFEEGAPARSGERFQSRALTVLRNEYADTPPMTADQWYARLLADKRLPKEEVEDVLGSEGSRLLLGEQSELPNDLVTSQQIQDAFVENSPVSQLETTVQSRLRRKPKDKAPSDLREISANEEAAIERAMTEAAEATVRENQAAAFESEVDDVLQVLLANEAENVRQNSIPRALDSRDLDLDTIERTAADVLGKDGAEKFLARLKNMGVETPSGEVYDSPFFTAEDIVNLNDDELYDLFAADFPLPEDVLEGLSSDPNQLRLGEEPEGFLANTFRREFTREQRNKIQDAWESALSEQREAFVAEKRVRDGDVDDFLRQQAIEEVTERNNDDFEFLVEQERDNLDPANFDPRIEASLLDPFITHTQYHGFQRSNPEAPYEELLVHAPRVGKSTHFPKNSRDLAAWSRVEILDEGTTYSVLEVQSDLGQAMRGGKNILLKNTERWVRVATGASLHRAAELGMDNFAWSTAVNRVSQANLPRKAATITYDKAVPDVLRDFFKHLGEPMPEITPESGRWQIKLTPEMKAKILKAGVPALGVAGAVQVREQQSN